MRFDAFVRCLLTGTFAIHGAQRNGHALIIVHHSAVQPNGHIIEMPDTRFGLQPGMRSIRKYKCLSERAMLRHLQLDAWIHTEEVLVVDHDHFSVTDSIWWRANCAANRRYDLYRQADGSVVRRNAAWNIQYDGASVLQRPVMAGMRKAFEAADRDAFSNLTLEEDFC